MGGPTASFTFDVVATEVRHAPAACDVIQRANGYPIGEERRIRHTRFVADQLERFAEGQFVAVTREGGEERVIGTACTMRTDRPPSATPLTWWETIGDYGLPRHDPEGAWLYGVEIAVDPAYQRRGVATALYKVRLALVEELGLAGWYAGGMLMGYHHYADVLTPRAYAERVIAGELADPTVSMQLRRGLVASGIIEGYFPEPKAGDCAVLLTYVPQRGRAVAPERTTVPAGRRAAFAQAARSASAPAPTGVAAGGGAGAGSLAGGRRR